MKLQDYEILFSKVGMPLIPKQEITHTGNVIIFDINKETGEVTLLTDFGNILKRPSVDDVMMEYMLPKWAYIHNLNKEDLINKTPEELFGLSNIKDRLDTQLELLSEALKLDSKRTSND